MLATPLFYLGANKFAIIYITSKPDTECGIS